MSYDGTKFKCLVHYVCESCKPHKLGAVKLHKVLYFSDMLNFVRTGNPLTGATYVKQQFGPIAKPLWDAINDLSRENAIEVRDTEFYGFVKKEYHSLQNADVSCFSNSEIDLINDVIDFVCNKTAKEISELSHKGAWEFAEMGEELPYFTAFQMYPVAITPDDIEWGTKEAQRIVDKGIQPRPI